VGEIYNVYCDESGHLETDHLPVMVLGAVWCPLSKTRDIAENIRKIKERFGLSRQFEIKWTKVSPGKVDFYLAMIRYFFDEPDLHFRALVVPEKSKLRHEDFQQDHDTFYYKMYFEMLNRILAPDNRYRIYLDIKDTRSAQKMALLRKVLSFNMGDFDQSIVELLQPVRSHEVEQVQLADLLIGAVQYAHRDLVGSPAKVRLVEQLQEYFGYALNATTPERETKFNLFVWRARERT
jgi:hypothetical protein